MDIWDSIVIAALWPAVWYVTRVFPIVGSFFLAVAVYTA